jgi:hypothetical protein
MSSSFIFIVIQDRNAMRNHILFDHPSFDVYMTPCGILYASNHHSRRAEGFICRHRLCLRHPHPIANITGSDSLHIRQRLLAHALIQSQTHSHLPEPPRCRSLLCSKSPTKPHYQHQR